MLLNFATCHTLSSGAISLRELVLVSFSPAVDGAVAEMLMMLRVFPGVFALYHGLLMMRSLRANVFFFACHPLLISRPLSDVITCDLLMRE